MASSDVSSDSSSSEEEYRKRKSSKKHKHKSKSEKKHKKQKVKKSKKSKRKRRASTSSSDHETPTKVAKQQPRAPTAAARDTATVAAADGGAFGPALPPHLMQKPVATESQRAPIIGPTIPAEFAKMVEASTVGEAPAEDEDMPNVREQDASEESSSDDEPNTHGPRMPRADGSGMSSTQIELEQRALQLKIAAIESSASGTASDQKEREEWMMELPEVGLKGGLAALSNMKRTFYQGKERPDFSDRSSWTKTPNSEGKPSKASSSKSTTDTLKDSAQRKYEHERDAEQERIAKKLKKKHKRDESLVELHQKKLRKEKREREKELAASGAKPERRPFSRDVDLKLNKIDSNQTKQIVDKAKILNTKFSSGHTKYL